MKIIIRLLVFVYCVLIASAQSDPEDELNRIAAMNAALKDGGIGELLKQAKEHAWPAPFIPSQWHVGHVSVPKQKGVDVAARELGRNLAEQLDDQAAEMQQIEVGDRLYDETSRLIDLSDWCAATDGYGNIFLAQRSLDLAAVGAARLAASLGFPIKRIDVLLTRMSPGWMSAEANQRVLNKDAGATVFTVSNREEMERTYGSGHRLLKEQRDSSLYAQRQKSPQLWRLVETPAVKANLSFFEGVEIGQVRPATLVKLWDRNWHLRIINGLELQSVEKAKALAEFRRTIGKFPEKPVFTEAEIRERERGAAAASKAGLKIINMEDTYSTPQAAAFALAWQRYLRPETENSANLPQKRYSLHVVAFQAYDEVRRGVFFDQDTANIRRYEAQMKTPPTNP